MKEYICVESPNEVDGGMLVREQELIRCKDCTYLMSSRTNFTKHVCYWGKFYKELDDFCSWAKRKETNDESER